MLPLSLLPRALPQPFPILYLMLLALAIAPLQV